MEPTVLLDATAVKSAAVVPPVSESGSPTLHLILNEAGAKQFAEVTARCVGRRVAILLGHQLRSAPVVRQAILGGDVEISGNFTPAEATGLVARLNAAVVVARP